MGIMINYAQLVVVRLQETCKKVDATYSDVVAYALGHRGVLVSRFFLVTMQWGMV